MHEPSTSHTRNDSWALILAGGDGTRLRDLTRLIAGEPIPKQYCRITGTRSMLEATLDRVRPLVPPERTVVIVNRDHLKLALPQLAGIPAPNVLVQPRNLDTGPGILWSLLEIHGRAPHARVAMFPSDHFVAHDAPFRDAVRRALAVVARRPDKLALLGIEPEDPSPEFGYVVPASPLDAIDREIFEVASFREKPSALHAARIVRGGGLWNSFVMAFRVSRVLDLVAQRLPESHAELHAAYASRRALEAYYAAGPKWNFSHDFLSTVAQHLVVVRAEHTGWSDWGTPSSIERTFAALNRVPPWQARRATASLPQTAA
jgi:mannose-1-phosphate guanylyltransferase